MSEVDAEKVRDIRAVRDNFVKNIWRFCRCLYHKKIRFLKNEQNEDPGPGQARARIKVSQNPSPRV